MIGVPPTPPRLPGRRSHWGIALWSVPQVLLEEEDHFRTKIQHLRDHRIPEQVTITCHLKENIMMNFLV